VFLAFLIPLPFLAIPLIGAVYFWKRFGGASAVWTYLAVIFAMGAWYTWLFPDTSLLSGFLAVPCLICARVAVGLRRTPQQGYSRYRTASPNGRPTPPAPNPTSAPGVQSRRRIEPRLWP
jgi:hypothetical protein